MTDEHHADRRSFLKTGAIAGTALVAGATAMAQQVARADDADDSDRGLTKGDVAILRFLAAVEILETDLWQQYNELGGIQDSEVPGGSGSPDYTKALKKLDGDMDQYIHDNTEDEFTHFLSSTLTWFRKAILYLTCPATRCRPKWNGTLLEGASHGHPDTSHHYYSCSPPWWRRLVRPWALVLGASRS